MQNLAFNNKAARKQAVSWSSANRQVCSLTAAAEDLLLQEPSGRAVILSVQCKAWSWGTSSKRAAKKCHSPHITDTAEYSWVPSAGASSASFVCSHSPMWMLLSHLTNAAYLVACSFLLCALRHTYQWTLESIFILSCFEDLKFGHVQYWIEMCTKGQILLLFSLPHPYTCTNTLTEEASKSASITFSQPWSGWAVGLEDH